MISLPELAKKKWIAAMQLGYVNIIGMFGDSIMCISLGMYVMATCTSTLEDPQRYAPGHLFHWGRSRKHAQ